MLMKVLRVFSILIISSFLFCGKTENEMIEEAIKERVAGKYAQAETILREALAKSENEVIYKELCNIYLLGMENLEEAEKYYMKSLQINPSYINSIHNMGLVYLKRYEQSQDQTGKGDMQLLEKAHSYLQKSLAINSQFLLSRQEMAKYHFYKGEFDKAISEIQIAIAQDSRNARGYSIAGQIYLKGKNDLEKALRNFEDGYALNRQDTDLLLLLARTTKMLKDEVKADFYLKQYREIMRRKGYSDDDIEKIANATGSGFGN